MQYDRAIALIQYYVQLTWLVFGAFLLAETVLLTAIGSLLGSGDHALAFAGALFGLLLVLPWWASFKYNHSLYKLRVYEARALETVVAEFFTRGNTLLTTGRVVVAEFPEIRMPRLARILAPRRSVSLLIALFALAFASLAIHSWPTAWGLNGIAVSQSPAITEITTYSSNAPSGGTGPVLQLIASLVASLAWPIAVLFGIYLLRSSLSTLLSSVRSLRYGRLGVDFRDALRRAERAASLAGAGTSSDAAPAEIDRNVFLEIEREIADLLRVSPSAAVAVAWTAVERSLLRARERLGIEATGLTRPSMSRLIRDLALRGQIGTAEADLLDRLRRIRNEAVHSDRWRFGPTRQQAEDYAHLVARACRLVDRIGRQSD